jgi:hypothetical protein
MGLINPFGNDLRNNETSNPPLAERELLIMLSVASLTTRVGLPHKIGFKTPSSLIDAQSQHG